jgi:DNA-binding transcriptional ArsR family regulator
VLDVDVISDPAAAGVSLEPVRTRLLAELAEPGTATSLAARMGLPRQKVNYHLRTLERHGLVRLVDERRKGNVTERLLQASAASYVISPAALALVQPDPDRAPDRLSAFWVLALGARLVREVGALITGSRSEGKRLATFGLDSEIRFATAADRAAFAEELSTSLAGLIARYHDGSAPAGRNHRVIVAIHPAAAGESPPITTRKES